MGSGWEWLGLELSSPTTGEPRRPDRPAWNTPSCPLATCCGPRDPQVPVPRLGGQTPWVPVTRRAGCPHTLQGSPSPLGALHPLFLAHLQPRGVRGMDSGAESPQRGKTPQTSKPLRSHTRYLRASPPCCWSSLLAAAGCHRLRGAGLILCTGCLPIYTPGCGSWGSGGREAVTQTMCCGKQRGLSHHCHLKLSAKELRGVGGQVWGASIPLLCVGLTGPSQGAEPQGSWPGGIWGLGCGGPPLPYLASAGAPRGWPPRPTCQPALLLLSPVSLRAIRGHLSPPDLPRRPERP